MPTEKRLKDLFEVKKEILVKIISSKLGKEGEKKIIKFLLKKGG